MIYFVKVTFSDLRIPSTALPGLKEILGDTAQMFNGFPLEVTTFSPRGNTRSFYFQFSEKGEAEFFSTELSNKTEEGLPKFSTVVTRKLDA